MTWLRSIIALATIMSASFAYARDQVWFETPFAETTIGLEPSTGAPFQRAFYLAFVGPQEKVPNPRVARQCAEEVVKPLRDLARTDILARDRGDIPEQIEKRIRYYNEGTSSALLGITIHTTGQIIACIRKNGAPELDESGFFLSLVQRDCIESVCKLSRTQRRKPDDEDSRVFSALYRWTASNSAVEQRNTSNQHFRLNLVQGQDNGKGIGYDYFAVQADFEPICEVNRWPGYSSPADCRIKIAAPLPLPDGNSVERFRALVNDAREASAGRRSIAFEAGLIVEISRSDFLRVADVMAAADEGYARADVTAKDLLNGVSNELARLRVAECRYYRGLRSINEIAQCSGLAPDAQSLAACLGARVCEPAVPDSAQAIAFLINDPRSIKDLASRSALPRYLPGDFGATVKAYNECASNADASGADRCFRSKLIGSDPKLATLDRCFAEVSTFTQANCAITSFGESMPPEVECASRSGQRAIAECLIAPSLPVDVQKVYNCRDKGGRTLAACAAGLVGGDGARVLACRAKNRESDLLFAECLLGDQMPRQVANGLRCLGQTKAALNDFATCAVTASLPQEVSDQVGCVLQSQGDLVGAGTCIATQRLNLSPNQQLALQCMTSTGGEPQSFAICFGGQLTMQEMKKCRGKSFGQDECFGENNEFQRLAKSITGDKISSNSVVGQIITINMKPAVFLLSMAEPIADVTADAVTRVGNVLDRTSKDVDAALKGNLTGLVNVALAPLVAPIRFFFPSF